MPGSLAGLGLGLALALALLLLLLLRGACSRSGEPLDAAGQCRPPGSQGDLNSFLWTIHRDPPAYLFGTIHVPYTRVWDFIPDNSKAAFEASARVYFELDLTDPYTISALASCQLLPHGENLQDVLPRELYRRLKRHLDYVKLMMPTWMTPDQRGKGLYADYLFNAIAGNWERKRPVWVMLMVNSLTETDVRSRGVPVLDLYLAQEAERMKKRTGAVERVEEQCHPLNGLNFSQVLFALNQTLLQHESLRAGSLQAPYTTEDLIKHYNCGDLNAVIFNHDTSQVKPAGGEGLRGSSRREGGGEPGAIIPTANPLSVHKAFSSPRPSRRAPGRACFLFLGGICVYPFPGLGLKGPRVSWLAGIPFSYQVQLSRDPHYDPLARALLEGLQSWGTPYILCNPFHVPWSMEKGAPPLAASDSSAEVGLSAAGEHGDRRRKPGLEGPEHEARARLWVGLWQPAILSQLAPDLGVSWNGQSAKNTGLGPSPCQPLGPWHRPKPVRTQEDQIQVLVLLETEIIIERMLPGAAPGTSGRAERPRAWHPDSGMLPGCPSCSLQEYWLCRSSQGPPLAHMGWLILSETAGFLPGVQREPSSSCLAAFLRAPPRRRLPEALAPFCLTPPSSPVQLVGTFQHERRADFWVVPPEVSLQYFWVVGLTGVSEHKLGKLGVEEEQWGSSIRPSISQERFINCLLCAAPDPVVSKDSPQILSYSPTPVLSIQQMFFSFAISGHFLGNNTVIDVLRQAGFEVEHTPPGKAVHSSSPRSSQPPSPEPVVTMAPTVPPMEHSPPSSPASTPPGPEDEEEEEDDLLSPHLLLSDSLSQLEEFGRQKKWRRKHHKQHRPRQFNDLWVRIEDSTTTVPSPSRATSAYDTAKPPTRFAKQLEHRPPPAPPEPPGPSGSSAAVASPLTSFLLFTTGTILLQMVGPS
ncbi:metalloprotease TIKI2 [Sarcophilus harrisii]|uniref:metalloprotease TIKI2 n=1 Tax=Sarcophilus harrisii TaxID=9305 RepID=UPI001301B7A8|nr:metalloprotease TIKI2 [Sarcophilus harrisii]